MEYQQNRGGLPISVVVYVKRLRIDDLAPLVPAALEKLTALSAPAFIRVGVRYVSVLPLPRTLELSPLILAANISLTYAITRR